MQARMGGAPRQFALPFAGERNANTAARPALRRANAVEEPGFTIVAVITLALGIGANTAVFSLINAVLLRPLQFYEPERLVMVWEDASFAGFPQQDPAPANYVDWKARQSVFEDMAALESRGARLTGDGEPQQVYSYSVTANFFPLLGVAPALGRTFSPEEENPGANKVVVLSN